MSNWEAMYERQRAGFYAALNEQQRLGRLVAKLQARVGRQRKVIREQHREIKRLREEAKVGV